MHSARFVRVPRIAGLAACLAAAFGVCAASGCNEERKAECDRFVAAMRPLAEGTPTSQAVDGVLAAVSTMSLHDEPLRVYSKNYQSTLAVLSGTLKLKEGASSPDAVPDGTNAVIAKNLKDARADDADVTRYCTP